MLGIEEFEKAMGYACRMCLFKKLLLTETSKLQSSIRVTYIL